MFKYLITLCVLLGSTLAQENCECGISRVREERDTFPDATVFTKHKFPWLMRIDAKYELKNGTKGSFNCHGVLIDSKSVLTSTECRPEATNEDVKEVDYKLHVGNHKIHRVSVFHRPKKVKVTDLTKNSKDHFLILKLEKDVEKVSPICIPSVKREEKSNNKREFVTAGWIHHADKDRMSHEPRMATLPFNQLKADGVLTVAFGTSYFTSMQLESFEMGQPIMYKEDGRWFLHSIFTQNMKSEYKTFNQKAISSSLAAAVYEKAFAEVAPNTCRL
ncbi:uncharacterized protein LOC141854564 [Brevipalpus obovatus]|uniref:uncharacterized protein LOC141854564 n=1 Tax=Brevipalpus obovatus TaxID=246614 RepID=UPI003D9DF6C3